jgi:hypothetical protein
VEETQEKQARMEKPEVPPKPVWMKTKAGWRMSAEVEQQNKEQQKKGKDFGTPDSFHEGD